MNTMDYTKIMEERTMSTQLRLTADTHYSLRFPFSEQFLMNDFPAPLDTRLREAWSFA